MVSSHPELLLLILAQVSTSTPFEPRNGPTSAKLIKRNMKNLLPPADYLRFVPIIMPSYGTDRATTGKMDAPIKIELDII